MCLTIVSNKNKNSVDSAMKWVFRQITSSGKTFSLKHHRPAAAVMRAYFFWLVRTAHSNTIWRSNDIEKCIYLPFVWWENPSKKYVYELQYKKTNRKKFTTHWNSLHSFSFSFCIIWKINKQTQSEKWVLNFHRFFFLHFWNIKHGLFIVSIRQ